MEKPSRECSRYGAGSVAPEGNRWSVRRYVNGKRVRFGKYDTEEEACKALDALNHELHKQPHIVPGGVTLRDYGESFLARREARTVTGSRPDDRSKWNRHVCASPFIDEPLVTIDEYQIQEWIDSLIWVPAGPGRGKTDANTIGLGTIKKIRSLLSACFRRAKKDRLVKKNPVEGVELPDLDDVLDREAEWTYLSPAEIDKVASLLSSQGDTPKACRERAAGALFMTAIYTGLRRGELWGLQWVDAELEGPRPHVIVRRSNKRKPKNGKVRHVPLIPPARDVLANWKKECPESKQGWVFPARGGGQRGASNNGQWQDKRYRQRKTKELRVTPGYCTRLGLRHVRFHDLRHSCASHLLMGTWGRTWTLEEIREVLGHSSIALTQRYAHLAPEALHRGLVA